jgi:glycosyltransferase involved in cell wall biosynthesis
VSEPDHGQAHAINKGFRIARGQILGWLNSDDLYLPQTIDRVVSIIGNWEQPKLIYGSCILLNEEKRSAYTKIAPAFDPLRLTYYDYIMQPCTFWSKSLWDSAGEIDENYHYALDWEWYLRASKICSFTPVPDCLSIYRLHSEHKTSSGGIKRAKEILEIVSKYASQDWVNIYLQAFDTLYSKNENPEKKTKKVTLSYRIRFHLSRLLSPDPPPSKSIRNEPTPLELAIATLT